MTEEVREVEIRVQALKNTMGLIDHYYMVLNGMEYHPGNYRLGNILPLDSTKGYHVVMKKRICIDCYNKIVTDFNMKEDKRIASFYPFLNCESLTTGISAQSMAFIAIPFVVLLVLRGMFLWALVLLLATFVYMLGVSKFVFSRTTSSTCKHLRALSSTDIL